jgi:hypothetical protein
VLFKGPLLDSGKGVPRKRLPTQGAGCRVLAGSCERRSPLRHQLQPASARQTRLEVLLVRDVSRLGYCSLAVPIRHVLSVGSQSVHRQPSSSVKHVANARAGTGHPAQVLAMTRVPAPTASRPLPELQHHIGAGESSRGTWPHHQYRLPNPPAYCIHLVVAKVPRDSFKN